MDSSPKKRGAKRWGRTRSCCGGRRPMRRGRREGGWERCAFWFDILQDEVHDDENIINPRWRSCRRGETSLVYCKRSPLEADGLRPPPSLPISWGGSIESSYPQKRKQKREESKWEPSILSVRSPLRLNRSLDSSSVRVVTKHHCFPNFSLLLQTANWISDISRIQQLLHWLSSFFAYHLLTTIQMQRKRERETIVREIKKISTEKENSSKRGERFEGRSLI